MQRRFLKPKSLVALFAIGLAILCLKSAALAQESGATSKSSARDAVYRLYLGKWQGKLTYRDYKTNERVVLPTQLEVTRNPQLGGMAFHFVYDDGPGKTVEENETVTIDADRKVYTSREKPEDAGRLFHLAGLEKLAKDGLGTMVLTGTGTDTGQPADVRNIVTFGLQSLTILHETRPTGGSFAFRNVYDLTRQKEQSVHPLVSAKLLQSDFVIFRRAYEQLHPGLYRYNTPAQIDAHFVALRSALNHDQSLADAYIAFATFLTQIQCGHSYPNFYNQPRAVVDALFRGQNRVPFYFRWIDHRMIVTQNFSDDPHLLPGTEILSIGGIPSKEILAQLLTVSRADGGNEAKRISNLEVTGIEQYPAFDIYFPMLYPQMGSSLRLAFQTAGTTAPATITVSTLTYEQRLAPYKAQMEALLTDKPFWELKFLDNDATAVLVMPSWALYNSKWDWQAFIDASFEQIGRKKCGNLIIDLRGNEGGNSVGDVLLSHLIRSNLHLPGEFRRWTRYKAVPDDLKPYLDTWDKSFLDWGSDAHGPDDGFYRMTRFDDAPEGDVIHPAPHPFGGTVYVLIDASNSSATFEFARQIRESRLGLLAGQTTGGSLRGINGGAFFFLRLPGSGIETDIPLVGAYPPSVRPSASRKIDMTIPDTGLTPDIPIKPSIEDIRLGVDTELQAVREAIGKRRP